MRLTLLVHIVQSNLFPCAYARHILHRRVFGAVIAGHGLAAAFVRGVRRTRAREILLGGLHDTFGALNPLMNPIPVLTHLCVCFFFSGCTVSLSFSCRHPVRFDIVYTNCIIFYFISLRPFWGHPARRCIPQKHQNLFSENKKPRFGDINRPIRPHLHRFALHFQTWSPFNNN